MKFVTDPQNILRTVDIVYQVMDKASYRHDGLFPAFAERHNGNLLMDFPAPAPIPGQRNSDRSPRGCNLQHDISLLASLHGLGVTLKRDRYLMLREEYLKTFATVCAPPSPTGLLPWGEHSYWDLALRHIGNSYKLQYGNQPLDAGIETHHQLFTLPYRDWKTIHEANPNVIPRFCDGLDWHWMDEERTQFNRHANMTQLIRGYQIKRAERITGKPAKQNTGSDFPGAAGMFIHDYAAALALVENPKPEWKEALLRFCDSWWNRRLETGVLPKSGATNPKAWNGPDMGQTMSITCSMFQAAAMLREAGKEAELADLLFDRAKSYIDSMVKLPQPLLAEGKLVQAYNEGYEPARSSQPWAGNRGTACTAKSAVNWLYACQQAGNDDGIEIVKAASEKYHTEFIARDLIVRAGDPGAVIGLTGELFRITQDQKWLDTALMHATDAMELFFDCPLPRMSTGRDHYEAQQGSGTLVHALGRLVLIAEGKEPQGGMKEIYNQ